MSCGVGHRRSLDLLWLAVIAPIRPLVWEPTHAMEATLEKANKQNKKKKRPVVFSDVNFLAY